MGHRGKDRNKETRWKTVQSCSSEMSVTCSRVVIVEVQMVKF